MSPAAGSDTHCGRAVLPATSAPLWPLMLLDLCLAAQVPKVREVVVVTRSGAPELREGWADAASRLRAELVARGVGKQLPTELHAILEGHTPVEAPFRPDLGPVRRAYGAFDYDRANALAEALLAEVLARATAEALPGYVAEISRWRGTIAVAAGHEARAYDAFLLLSRVAPGQPLDPALFPPPVLRAHHRATETDPGVGRVRVTLGPPAAMARVDHRIIDLDSGVTVPAGPHLLVLQGEGLGRRAEVIDVPAGSTSTIGRVLTPAPTDQLVRESLARLPRGPRGAVPRLGRRLGAGRVVVIVPQDQDRAVAEIHVIGGDREVEALTIRRSELTSLAKRLADYDPAAPPLVGSRAPAAETSGVLRSSWFWGAVAGTVVVVAAAAIVAAVLPAQLELCVSRSRTGCGT